MDALSTDAATILEHMEPNRGYDMRELRRVVPDLTLERVHEVMRELWVHRRVERVGYSGWRKECSSSAGGATKPPARSDEGTADRQCEGEPRKKKGIRPEDLFDHSGFEGIFK
jgi:hypothetical protein